MTTAGDVGSATTGGTAPMVKVGVHAPVRRELPNKKQGKKKLKSFRELVKDNVSEEDVYIDSNLKKEFENIVEKLGGVRKANKLLNEGAKLIPDKTYVKNNDSSEVVDLKDFDNKAVYFYSKKRKRDIILKKEIFKSQYSLLESKSNQSIEEFIRSMGFKIKDEKAGIRTKEILFFKEEDAQEAFEDLEGENYDKKYNITLKNKSITYNI